MKIIIKMNNNVVLVVIIQTFLIIDFCKTAELLGLVDVFRFLRVVGFMKA